MNPEVLETTLAARVLDALLRENYGGLRGHMTGDVLRLPGHEPVPLLAAGPDAGPARRSVPGVHPGFLTDLVVRPRGRLRLDDVLAAVRAVADPGDDVAAFEDECRRALQTARLHESARPAVLARLARLARLAEPGRPDGPDGSAGAAAGPGIYYETLAAFNDHPVYPTGRCRAGLTADDLRRYAPEFAPRFRLRWTAVPRDRVTAAGTRPGWWPRPAQVGLPAGLDSSHDLLPVHPLAATGAAADVTAGPGLLPAPEPHLEVAPTLSMRTVVVLAAHPAVPSVPAVHLKVPLPTSTLGLRNRRTIVPRTLADGALAERILRRVLHRERHLPVLLADEQTHGHAGDPLLGYLVRRFPAEVRDAHVVPVAALLAAGPDGRYVIERWPVRELFHRYLDVLFAWNVTLFRYGLAVEAHQQNVSLVLPGADDVTGLRLLLKDNDGTLVRLDRLNAALGAPQHRPEEFADRRMLTSDDEALARVFVTITLHLCAGALAFGLAERGLLPAADGLELIRDRLDRALGPADSFLRARTLDAARLPTKAMLTAGTLVPKARTGARDINKHYGPAGPNYLRPEASRPHSSRDDT